MFYPMRKKAHGVPLLLLLLILFLPLRRSPSLNPGDLRQRFVFPCLLCSYNGRAGPALFYTITLTARCASSPFRFALLSRQSQAKASQLALSPLPREML